MTDATAATRMPPGRRNNAAQGWRRPPKWRGVPTVVKLPGWLLQLAVYVDVTLR